jgi:hypothetical protein
MFGTRDDPHAQSRAARSQPLLLHSMSVFQEIFEIVFAHRKISTVVEIGVESGQVSGLYLELGASEVYCVDPVPSDELRATLAGNDALHLVTQASPEALATLPPADLYVLDGDHNYAVVERELAWIVENAPDAVVAFHDVLWPCSRRDLYYQPSVLAPGDKHLSSEDGPTIWHDELTPAGFIGAGAFTMAERAGGERNGVLTAIEDVLGGVGEDWDFVVIPAIFGMGVAVRRDNAATLVESLRPFAASRLLATMENNRIAMYTRILQMQYDAAAHATGTDALADTVSAQRREIERLETELRTSAVQHEGELRGRDAENLRLRQLAETPGALVKKIGREVASRVRRSIS